MMETNKSLVFRPMNPGEESRVMNLVLRVFTEFVAPQFSPQGIAEFEKFVRSDAMAERARAGNPILLAASRQSIHGVIEMRENSHIALLFVEKSLQRKGIARELVHRGIEICRKRNPEILRITVNSSPNACEAYQKMGFRRMGDESVQNGIRYIPMELLLEHNNNDLTVNQG